MAIKDWLKGSGRARGVWLSLAVLLMLAAVAGLVGRSVTPGPLWTLTVAAFAPYLMLGAALAVIAALLARRWLAVLVAVVLLAVGVGTQYGLYRSAAAPKAARQIVVMTANLHLGSANATAVVAAVRSQRVDVLMLEELTAQEVARLNAAGLSKVLPHHAARAGGGSSGTGLWSRWPLTDTHFPRFTLAAVQARIRVPHLPVPPTFLALHMAGPDPDPKDWHADIARLPGTLQNLPPGRPVVVGGDFNATPDTAQFRAALVDGYHDAADQAGAGITRTYPAGRRVIPPLIAIDHVLTRGAVATDVQTVGIKASDHLALLARVSIPDNG